MSSPGTQLESPLENPPTSSPAPGRGGAETTSTRPPTSLTRRLLSAFGLPVFFVVFFSLAYVSALHQPAPHDLALEIVGPTAVAAPIAQSLDQTEQFQASHTDDPGAAEASVKNRDAVGSILIAVTAPADPSAAPTYAVTTYVAAGGGRSAVGAVEAAGAQIASQLNVTPTVVDLAPLAPADSLGSDLFYLLIFSSIGGYLVIVTLTQVLPSASFRARWLAAGISSVLTPLVAFGLASIFVGDYGQSFGTIAALLGVDMLYVFTVSALMILMAQFLGAASTFGLMAFVVILNFPSSGGATGAAMLPPFWQAVHGVYFGAGAMESFRSLVYFGGNGMGRWMLQLTAWAAALVLLTVIVELAKTVLRQRGELAALRPPRHRHLVIDSGRAGASGTATTPSALVSGGPRVTA